MREVPGGAVAMSFNAVEFRDTRIDIRQRSVGAHLRVRARSNVRLEFGAEYVHISQRGETNRPHSLYARGSVNF